MELAALTVAMHVGLGAGAHLGHGVFRLLLHLLLCERGLGLDDDPVRFLLHLLLCELDLGPGVGHQAAPWTLHNAH